jgi:hypothetical protein
LAAIFSADGQSNYQQNRTSSENDLVSDMWWLSGCFCSVRFDGISGRVFGAVPAAPDHPGCRN